jgi:hypothetical protein
MSLGIENTHRSNHSIFFPQSYGSPLNDITKHISGLGLRRLDFERCAIAGEVLYTIEGDTTPTSQQDDEARIATLAYALKKLGNPEDAAEFMRCLNAICEEGDARYRQVAASFYYKEIAERGTADVLKEMGLLAMELASLNPVTEVNETETPYPAIESESAVASLDEPDPKNIRLFLKQEMEAINLMIRSRRKGAGFAHDEWTEWLNDLEASGASLKELDEAFTYVDSLDQYDEGGAIIQMSAHERTLACGHVDHEFTADDLPERARHLAPYLRRAYSDGAGIDEIWEDINAHLDVLFPVTGKNAEGGRFFSWANLDLQRLSRDALEAILDDCRQDCHISAMRCSGSYRRFYQTIREADDTKVVGQAMKEAYAAKESGELSLKHFILLKTASVLQRERLDRAPLSKEARTLIREVETASPAKLRYLSWAFYGKNQPEHPIHSLPTNMVYKIWDTLKSRKLKILGPTGQNMRQADAGVARTKRKAASGGHALPAIV